MKPIFIRYLSAVSLLISCLYLAPFYYSSSFYTGYKNNLHFIFPTNPAEIVNFFLIFFLLFGLKYLIYDFLGHLFIRKSSQRIYTFILYLGYGTTLMIDLSIVSALAQPDPESGFAIILAFTTSPQVLLFFAIILAITTWIGGYLTKKHAVSNINT